MQFDEEIIKCIPDNEKFICLYSGGKDCALAFSIARQKADAVALIHCIKENTERTIFHDQEKDVVEAQAKAIGLPLIYHYEDWWSKWDTLIKIYLKYKNEGVKYVVFGDLNSYDNAKIQIELCKGVGLIPCFPLWQASYDELIEELYKHKIVSIITNINHPSINAKFLGEVFDKDIYSHFQKIGIDPFGENGEFHTTVVSADCFSASINYIVSEKKEKDVFLKIIS